MVTPVGLQPHILRQLVFPARYEALAAQLGSEVARLLVPPGAQTQESLERVGLSVRSRREGILVPLHGLSGTGKTTLANNLTTFLPLEFGPTIVHTGAVTFEALLGAAQAGTRGANAAESRAIPVNIDHRESAPPSAEELASIKRFVREPTLGNRCIVLWPETSDDIARSIARAYADVAGTPPVELPIEVEGPARATWVEIAVKTLELSNDLASLESIGVDPKDYLPDEYFTLGDFLGEISKNFVDHVFELISSTQRPLGLVIAFVSESSNAGVLSQLTSSTHYGLVDSHALVAATPESEIGRWWAERPGSAHSNDCAARLSSLVPAAPRKRSNPSAIRSGGSARFAE